LPDKYLKHFLLLVNAVYLLLQDSISPEQLNLADTLLYRFVCEVEILYGPMHMIYNVHCLTHVAKCVKLHGPLWSHSAFAFENCNGSLIKLVKGTKGVPIQIVKRFLLRVSYSLLSSSLKESIDVDNLLHSKTLTTRKIENIGSVYVIGDPQNEAPLPNEIALFEENGILAPAILNKYARIIYKGVKYHSKLYSRCKMTNDQVVRFTDDLYGEIQFFCHILNNPKTFIVCSTFILSDENVLSYKEASTSHIKKCDRPPQNVISLRIVEEVKEKALFIDFGNDMFVVNMPNKVEVD